MHIIIYYDSRLENAALKKNSRSQSQYVRVINEYLSELSVNAITFPLSYFDLNFMI